MVKVNIVWKHDTKVIKGDTYAQRDGSITVTSKQGYNVVHTVIPLNEEVLYIEVEVY